MAAPEQILAPIAQFVEPATAYSSASAAATMIHPSLARTGVPISPGGEYYTLHIRDLTTGKDTGELIEDIAGGGVWSADPSAIYYFRVRRQPPARSGCAAMSSARRRPTTKSSTRKGLGLLRRRRQARRRRKVHHHRCARPQDLESSG